MKRTYRVILEHGGNHYEYVVTVDDEDAARREAILDARVRAAADYRLLPHQLNLWKVQECPEQS